MLALLSTRLRRLLFAFLAVPVLARLLHGAGRRVEASRGPSRLSRSLQTSGRTLGRASRGPLRTRFDAYPSGENVTPKSRARPAAPSA